MTDTQWNEYIGALDTVAKIESRLRLDQDGQQTHGKITNRLQCETIFETTIHVLVRNLFPFAADEETSAIGALWSARNKMTPELETKGILSEAEMEIQHGYEVCKAKVRAYFPLDEIGELQRYYIEEILFRVKG